MEPRGIQQDRERLLNEEIAESFFQRVLERAKPYMSDEHFTVDGTLIEAWASHRVSGPRTDLENLPTWEAMWTFAERSARTRHMNQPPIRMPGYSPVPRKRGEAELPGTCIDGESKRAIAAETFLSEASGRAERDAALLMAEALPAGKRVTLGGDKNYDTQEFVRELRGMNITPHVAQNTTKRRSAVDERTVRHAGYAVSQRKRKRVEQSFGWMKMIGMLKKVKLRGIEKVGWLFTFTGAAYNLCRLRNLMART